MITLLNGSKIPLPYVHYIGAGVKNVGLKATADCDGFIRGVTTF